MNIQVGDDLPDIRVFHYAGNNVHPDGPKEHYLTDLAHRKKVIIIGVVGAFTPVCSRHHIPAFLDHHSLFLDRGIDEVWCISVNDPFVMSAWAEQLKVNHKIKMLSDGAAELATSLDLTLDLSCHGLGVRSDRYVMVVDNGLIKDLIIDDVGQLLNTTAKALIARLGM